MVLQIELGARCIDHAIETARPSGTKLNLEAGSPGGGIPFKTTDRAIAADRSVARGHPNRDCIVGPAGRGINRKRGILLRVVPLLNHNRPVDRDLPASGSPHIQAIFEYEDLISTGGPKCGAACNRRGVAEAGHGSAARSAAGGVNLRWQWCRAVDWRSCA